MTPNNNQKQEILISSSGRSLSPQICTNITWPGRLLTFQGTKMRGSPRGWGLSPGCMGSDRIAQPCSRRMGATVRVQSPTHEPRVSLVALSRDSIRHQHFFLLTRPSANIHPSGASCLYLAPRPGPLLGCPAFKTSREGNLGSADLHLSC